MSALATFHARVSGSGDCTIPENFGDPFRRLAAALDWTRVYVEQGHPHWASVELEAAADAADQLASMAREYARRARAMHATAVESAR
jgi:hypothetical protein